MPQPPRRIDPFDCACTDCIVGYSIPLQEASQAHLRNMILGLQSNATGYDISEFVIKIELPTTYVRTME